jgi:hypothetical protein
VSLERSPQTLVRLRHPPGEEGVVPGEVAVPAPEHVEERLHVARGTLGDHASDGRHAGATSAERTGERLDLLGYPAQGVRDRPGVHVLALPTGLLQPLQRARVGYDRRHGLRRCGLLIEQLELEGEAVAQQHVVGLSLVVECVEVHAPKGGRPGLVEVA